jgi:Uma2 family endonuclease
MAIANAAKHFFTTHDWHKMGEANIFPPSSRVELINGEILDMAPIGINHTSHLKRINKLFTRLMPEDLFTSVQDPLQLGDLSEPEPDFMLLKSEPTAYGTRNPNADDVLLLIEVADSSLKFDETEKLRLYALHGIPEYWILNVNKSCVEIYRTPSDEKYAEKITLYASDQITLSQLPNLTIQLADIL